MAAPGARLRLRFPPGGDPYRREWAYWIGWRLSRLILGTYFGVRYAGSECVPAEGPFILAGNHASYIDPPMLGAVSPRPVSSLGRESLWGNPVSAWILNSIGAVAVDRDGASGKGLKAIMERLTAGGGIILFPEGTRTRDGQFQAARAGVGMVVIRSGAPVLPARVFGTYEAFGRHVRVPRPKRVGVRLGAPMRFEAERAEAAGAPRPRVKAIYQEVADAIMAAIQRLDPP